MHVRSMPIGNVYAEGLRLFLAQQEEQSPESGHIPLHPCHARMTNDKRKDREVMSNRMRAFGALTLACLALAACSGGPETSEPEQAPPSSTVTGRRDELKLKFGKALASAIASDASLRELLKNEAMKMFDRDYDVLYRLIQDRKLATGKTVRETLLEHFESEDLLAEVEEALPLLTIFVPTLPENSFSAAAWDTTTQVPSVGVTSQRTNDVAIINATGETYTLEAQYIPGFPVVVVKENERVVQSSNAARASATGRELLASDGAKFTFLDDCFDGARVSAKAIDWLAIDADEKQLAAYNLYNPYDGYDGWQRDYIYYNITPSQPTGAFSFAYQEHVGSFRLVGDPAAAYSKIADQTGDPVLKAFTSTSNSGWTGGYFEFKVRTLFNAKNGLGTELVKYFSAMPNELFHVEYVRVGWLYKPRVTFLDVKVLNLPIFPWDLNDYATTISIEIEEVDTPETVVSTESKTVKFAANFGIEFSILKKIGLKFGASLEQTQTQTTQRTYSLGNDILGAVVVNFADNFLLYPMPGSPGNPPIHVLREYNSGWYSISVYPKRVQ